MAPTSTITPTSTAVPWPDTLQVTPGNDEWAAGISPQASFTLQFNQPMETDSAGLPLLFQPFVAGQHHWDETGTRLTFTPEDGFQPGRKYTVFLDEGLTAVSGLAFPEPQLWQIQVLPAPRLIGRVPGDRLLSDRRPLIKLTFDRPMDQDSVVAALAVTPELSMDFDWEENVLILQPADPLAPDQLYSFQLGRGATDSRGVPLADDYQWTYRARNLIARTTFPGETRRDAPIAIKFNYAMDAESVRQAIHLKPAVIGDITWDTAQKTATFTPAAPLATGTTYTVTFDETLRDAAGEPFPAAPEAFSFTTPPPVLRRCPMGGSVHPATTIEITFDRPADQATTAAALQISPSVWN